MISFGRLEPLAILKRQAAVMFAEEPVEVTAVGKAEPVRDRFEGGIFVEDYLGGPIQPIPQRELRKADAHRGFELSDEAAGAEGTCPGSFLVGHKPVCRTSQLQSRG